LVVNRISLIRPLDKKELLEESMKKEIVGQKRHYLELFLLLVGMGLLRFELKSITPEATRIPNYPTGPGFQSKNRTLY